MSIDKSSIYFSQLQNEDKILISKLLDMINTCENKHMPKFSFFLDERQCKLAEDTLKAERFHNYVFFGGFEDAKRKVLGVFPEYTLPSEQEFPIVAVKFSYRKLDKLSHKDFLGAIMSHQIKRDILGDILVNEGNSVAFIYNTVSDFLISEIKKIGSVGVKLSIENERNFVVNESFEIINGTVSALRTDAILSLAIKLSREKTALLIKSIGIDINYEKNYSPNEKLKLNDIFSLRGYGKFVLLEIGGTSKKDRIHIGIKKYI